MKPLHVSLLAACVLAGQCAFSADEPAAPVPGAAGEQQVRLEDLDEGIRTLRQLPWDFMEYAGQRAPDDSGRRVEDDVNEYVLTAPALEKITALRNELAASYPAGSIIPTSALQPLQQVMQGETCRLALLVAYWGTQHQHEYHREMIHQLIDRLPEADRVAASQELRSTDERSAGMREQIPGAMNSCRDAPTAGNTLQVAPTVANTAFQKSAVAMLEGFNALRRKLATQLDHARVGGSAAQAWTARAIACPAPATATTGSAAPGYRTRPDVAQYYPPDARNMDVSGIVRARVEYDETGCVKAVAIIESTGSDDLDTAAIRFLFDVALVPGEVDGKARGGIVVIPIRFSLRN